MAFYPVGYNQPKAARPDNNHEQKQKPNSDETGVTRQNSDLPKTSSTAQIKAALADNGLTVSNNDQPNNSRTLKALNAYTENRNQPAQLRVAEIISGIDLYV
ncbi:hypothetical protein A1342_10645 [Methylomonas methanica]|uniref:Uncharacterized protein n=1 Tax=Methylomonas denitrificans TaxID=1538553 RepID=A0A126T7B3_9GAMM|nr:hypothetical protein JT25_015995 [Methylomonas denitrificans]OAI07733.1 hypothetical protein A1342_10645 [Methylomonas methanica]